MAGKRRGKARVARQSSNTNQRRLGGVKIHFGRNTNSGVSNPLDNSPKRTLAMRQEGGMTAEIPWRQSQYTETEAEAEQRVEKDIGQELAWGKLSIQKYSDALGRIRGKLKVGKKKFDRMLNNGPPSGFRGRGMSPDELNELINRARDIRSRLEKATQDHDVLQTIEGKSKKKKEKMEESYHYKTFESAARYTNDEDMENHLVEVNEAFKPATPAVAFDAINREVTMARRSWRNSSWRNILLRTDKAKGNGVNYSKSALVMAANKDEVRPGFGGGVVFHLDGLGNSKEDIMKVLRKEAGTPDTVAKDELRFVYKYWSGDQAQKPTMLNRLRSFKYEHDDKLQEVQFHKKNTEFTITPDWSTKAIRVPPPWEWKDGETYDEVVQRV